MAKEEEKLEAGKPYQQELYLYQTGISSWDKLPQISVCDYSFLEPPEGWTLLDTKTVTWDIPRGWDPVVAGIKSVKAEITEIRQKAAKEVMGLEDKIQRLLAIEHKPHTAEGDDDFPL